MQQLFTSAPMLLLQRVRWLLELVVLVEVGFILLYTYQHTAQLPARIPAHFDANGLPNRWASRVSLYISPVIVVIVLILFSLVANSIIAWRYQGLERYLLLSLLAVLKGLLVLFITIEQVSFITKIAHLTST